MSDNVLEDILGWAKGIAVGSGAQYLDIEHILLGAIKCRNSHEILRNLLIMGEDLEADMQPELRSAFQGVSEPVLDRKMKLSPRLDKIIQETWERHNGLKVELLLKSIKESVASDGLWTRNVFKDAPPASSDKIKALMAALERVEDLEKSLNSRIIGQDMAIDQVCDAFFYPSFQDGSDPSRRVVRKGPLVVLTFLGPPGVGKTFMAELIAEHLAGKDTEPSLLRLDMSAYAGHQSHEQLVGFSAAYSGASEGILTAFVKKHPRGVVIADEIEKAHRNTQNLFLQLLDYGKIFENNTKEGIDCSGITIIFTTNLGKELYNTPEKFGLLRSSQRTEEVIIDALGRDVSRRGTEDTQGGLSPEMLSRLAKGHFVLFERLDALALERIAQRTVEQVSADLQANTGLCLDVSDPILLTLMILRFGINADARRLTTGLSNYLYSSIKDLLFENRLILAGDEQSLLSRVKGFRLCLPQNLRLPEPILEAKEGESRVLLIDEDEWPEKPVTGIVWYQVNNVDRADELLRSETIHYILLDLNIGATADDLGMDKGLDILQRLRTYFPEVPLYLFSESPGKRKLSAETLQNVARQGGARGVLQKLFYGSGEEDAINRDAFFRQLREIDVALKRERLLKLYRRHLKTLEFDLVLRDDNPDENGYLELELGRIREMMAVSAKDRSQIGWADIPVQRFADIAGAEHAKERLMEVSKWLTNARELRNLGLELPKGILLTGPPGTGKTSLARAVAGESQVPFFAISGSEVLSKWVGESEANIRELFGRARSYAPSIIFIDEIDGIGGRRSSDSEKDYGVGVLNQLLAQMDGFSQEAGRPVFVLAATNRPDMLDPALLRPGRFDLQIEVPLPSLEARKDMYSIYLKKVPVEDDISMASLAARSMGMSGAEIRQACKEAGWLAYREGSQKIRQKHMNEAITSVRFGLSSEQVMLDHGTRWSTAVHEAGHAIAQLKLFTDEPISQISILPRGRALGFMEHEPSRDFKDLSADSVSRRVKVLLAGRIAEELVLGGSHTTAGCADDLERASELATKMVACWGMNDKIGLLSLTGVSSALSASGQATADADILTEAKAWISDQTAAARALLTENRPPLERLAQELTEKETLYKEDILKFVGQ